MDINLTNAAVAGVANETPQPPPVETRRVVALQGGPKAQGDPSPQHLRTSRSASAIDVVSAQKEEGRAHTPDVGNVVIEANHELERLSNTSIRFRVDQDAGELLISVVDINTDKVVRQIPSEEMVKMSARMKELQGILLNTEV